ncbi:MAG TPA: hypothetical protein VK474_06860 [Chthoniobacterales bacterium]|nr:hypothetical protein [Chthoniobacterales bacterium]
MAKEDKARVRVFFGEIEGDNESIKEGLKSIAVAVGRTFAPNEIKIIKTLKNVADDEAGGDDTDDDQLIEEALGGSAANANGSGSAGKSNKPSKPKKPPTYKTVPDLNLMPEGKQSLESFFNEKKPKAQYEEFVVILFYLTHILGRTGIASNHIYTGFNEVKRPVPNIQKMASTISARQGYVDASDLNDLKLTTPGENFVKHKLPKSGASSDEE